MSYLKSKSIQSTHIQNHFNQQLSKGKVTYWKPFRFGRSYFVMTFQYNLYKVVPNIDLVEQSNNRKEIEL